MRLRRKHNIEGEYFRKCKEIRCEERNDREERKFICGERPKLLPTENNNRRKKGGEDKESLQQKAQ